LAGSADGACGDRPEPRSAELLTIKNVWLIPSSRDCCCWPRRDDTAHRTAPARAPAGRARADRPRQRSNLLNLTLLTHRLLHGHTSNGHELILAGVEIWITNVLLFTVWYWELDRGGRWRAGSISCARRTSCPADDRAELGGWLASRLRRLLLPSFTNASAFSPPTRCR